MQMVIALSKAWMFSKSIALGLSHVMFLSARHSKPCFKTFNSISRSS